MPNCFVPGCKSGYRNNPIKHFFSPPKDPALFHKWKDAMPRECRPLTARSRICELHFPQDLIIKNDSFVIRSENVILPRRKWKLKPGAVPYKIFLSSKILKLENWNTTQPYSIVGLIESKGNESGMKFDILPAKQSSNITGNCNETQCGPSSICVKNEQNVDSKSLDYGNESNIQIKTEEIEINDDGLEFFVESESGSTTSLTVPGNAESSFAASDPVDPLSTPLSIQEAEAFSVKELSSSSDQNKRPIVDASDSNKSSEFIKLITSESSEFTVFGQHVATQLALLPLEEALTLQNEIQTMLTKARLRSIRKDTYPSTSTL